MKMREMTSFYLPYLAVPSRVYIFILSMRFVSLRSTALRTLLIDWILYISGLESSYTVSEIQRYLNRLYYLCPIRTARNVRSNRRE